MDSHEWSACDETLDSGTCVGLKGGVSSCIQQGCQGHWTGNTGDELLTIGPFLDEWRQLTVGGREDKVVLVQLIMGHMSLLRSEDQPTCAACWDALTVRCILAECTCLAPERCLCCRGQYWRVI